MDSVNAAGWQIIQKGDRLEVLLVQPRNLDTATLEAEIRMTLAAQAVLQSDVQVKQVAAIPRTQLGKAPLIMKAPGHPTAVP
jgi:phenylacetate-CoA ligase